LKLLEKKLLGYFLNLHIKYVGHTPLGYQYKPLLKALKSASSILCYSTQVNAIKQLLHYQETLSCVGVHYYVILEA